MVKSQIKSIPFLFWLVPAVIVISLIQIQPIRQQTDHPWWTLHRLAEPNLFSSKVLPFNESGRTNSLYTMFIKLGELTPQAEYLVIRGHNPFTRNSTERARLLAVSQPRKLTFVDSQLSYETVNQAVRKSRVTASGLFGESVSKVKDGRIVKWRLIASGADQRILFVRNSDDSQWLFVDTQLLPANLQSEIKT